MNWRCWFGHSWRLLWSTEDWDHAYLYPHEPVTFVERCEGCGRRRFIPPPYQQAYMERLKREP